MTVLTNETPSDAQWTAIVGCDAAHDGAFYYGVSTTRIFCRPSCKSREPMREHVRIFNIAADAAQAGFRPCKRCKPDGLRLPDEEWVDAIAESIRAHYPERITLDALAEQQHVSPYHLQRTFKRVWGESPADYLLRVRIEAAKTLLRETAAAIAEVGGDVGMPNAAHFATAFQKAAGCTPTQYRLAHRAPNHSREGDRHA
ncbi:bifunctional transcriptional activator/DNA repair enzyme AdaA [Paenibacillus sp. GCM10023250]|uniref:bifunctional transcriptional activator/DNA repair enzyme AdaA n=1 Tax=Paenibacillus sp. GCM10023250 TaxID=3252648 RepID=UPI00361BA59A